MIVVSLSVQKSLLGFEHFSTFFQFFLRFGQFIAYFLDFAFPRVLILGMKINLVPSFFLLLVDSPEELDFLADRNRPTDYSADLDTSR